jgi:hypothetical protein
MAAGFVALGTGTTSASATLVSPTGKADNAAGQKYTVIDSIAVSATTTAGITAGTLEVGNNGVGQGQLFSALATPANTPLIASYNFGAGWQVAHAAAGSVTVVLSGVTGALQSRLVVTYHFE